ncbi:MAG: hypothetical protein KGI50_01425 [Patescibacteria group bacterium]|nr:hypothetical protein [Patescibacteria group bacterium]MDE2437992.1 hypothetical protein [Patescibacteria group bacterium]
MITQELIAHINQQLAQGATSEAIRESLLQAGWPTSDIDEAFKSLDSQTSTLSSPKKSSNTLLISISALLIFCLIGGGAFAYFTFLTPNPTEIFKKSLQTSLNTTSFSFAATSTADAEIQIDNEIVPPLSNVSIASNSNGSIDFRSLDAPLFDVAFGTLTNFNTATSSGLISMRLNERYLNKNLYINLKNFNVSYTSTDPRAAGMQVFIGLANGFMASLENKWIRIDIDKTIHSVNSSHQIFLTQEDMTMIRNYVLSMSYVTSMSNGGRETVNNVPTYHLKVTTQHGQELINLIRKIILEKQTIVPKDMDAFNKNMEVLSRNISQKINWDIWVGRNDSLIYRITSSSLVIPIVMNGAQIGTVTGNLEVNLSNYNRPISVTVPQSALPLEQILQNLFTSMFGSKAISASGITIPNVSVGANNIQGLLFPRAQNVIPSINYTEAPLHAGDYGHRAHTRS